MVIKSFTHSTSNLTLMFDCWKFPVWNVFYIATHQIKTVLFMRWFAEAICDLTCNLGTFVFGFSLFPPGMLLFWVLWKFLIRDPQGPRLIIRYVITAIFNHLGSESSNRDNLSSNLGREDRNRSRNRAREIERKTEKKCLLTQFKL